MTNLKRRWSAADVDHGSGGGDEVGFADVVAGFFLGDDFFDKSGAVCVADASAHEFVEVVVPNGEQASTDFAVGCNAHAAALAAEWHGHWGNDADLADAVVKAIFSGRLAALVGNFH